LFNWAKEFRNIFYTYSLTSPYTLPLELKEILGILCDISKVDRKFILVYKAPLKIFAHKQ